MRTETRRWALMILLFLAWSPNPRAERARIKLCDVMLKSELSADEASAPLRVEALIRKMPQSFRRYAAVKELHVRKSRRVARQIAQLVRVHVDALYGLAQDVSIREADLVMTYAENLNGWVEHTLSKVEILLATHPDGRSARFETDSEIYHLVWGLLKRYFGEMGELQASLSLPAVIENQIRVEDLVSPREREALERQGLWHRVRRYEIDVVFDRGTSWGEVKYLTRDFYTPGAWVQNMTQKMTDLRLLIETLRPYREIRLELIFLGPNRTTLGFYRRMRELGIELRWLGSGAPRWAEETIPLTDGEETSVPRQILTPDAVRAARP